MRVKWPLMHECNKDQDLLTATARRVALRAALAVMIICITKQIPATKAAHAQERAELALVPGENRIDRDRVVEGQLVVPAGARVVIAPG